MVSMDGRWARRYGWIWLLCACGGRVGHSEGEVTHGSNGGVPNTARSTSTGGASSSSTVTGSTATGGTSIGVVSTVSGGTAAATGTSRDQSTTSGGIQVTQWQSRVTCGNLMIEPGEECDDGNAITGDGCSPTCKIEPGGCPINRCVLPEVCGDGRLGTHEPCDDGNVSNGDGCNSDCTSREPGWLCPWPGHACVTLCGDAIVAGAETCDEGNRNGVFVAGITTGCSHECRTVPGCLLDGAPSPCPDVCMDTAAGAKPAFCPGTCGDGVKDWNEQCDLGSDNSDGEYQSCTTECTYGSLCGDGTLDPPEACDHGSQNGTFAYGENGCSSLCQVTPFCGDGILDTAFGEDCDDGQEPYGFCTSECIVFVGP